MPLARYDITKVKQSTKFCNSLNFHCLQIKFQLLNHNYQATFIYLACQALGVVLAGALSQNTNLGVNGIALGVDIGICLSTLILGISWYQKIDSFNNTIDNIASISEQSLDIESGNLDRNAGQL